MFSSVWPGSSAIACNFGEGSDFLSDRKQMPKLTLAACKILAEKLNREKASSSPREKPALYQAEANSSKMANLSPDPYLLK